MPFELQQTWAGIQLLLSKMCRFIVPMLFLLAFSILTTEALKCWSGTDMSVGLFNLSTKVEQEECKAEVANCHKKHCQYGTKWRKFKCEMKGNGSTFFSSGCGGMEECESGAMAMLCKTGGQLTCTNCTGELCNGAVGTHFVGTLATILAIFIAFFVLQNK